MPTPNEIKKDCVRLAVVGSRTFHDYNRLREVLFKYTPSEIVSGGAVGTDSLAERYAKEQNIALTIFRPDWNTHGKKAGFLRNKIIVEHSDRVIAFWDGKSKGTKSTIDYAKQLKKECVICLI